MEACGFRDRIEQLAQLDAVVIGISVDQLKDLEEFTQMEKLNYPLCADAEKSIAKAFGVLGANGFAQRKTFVIDKKGVVRKVFSTVMPATHADEVVAFVKESQSK